MEDHFRELNPLAFPFSLFMEFYVVDTAHFRLTIGTSSKSDYNMDSTIVGDRFHLRIAVSFQTCIGAMFPNYPQFNTPPNDSHLNHYNSPPNEVLNDSTTVPGTPPLHQHQLSNNGSFGQYLPYSNDPSGQFTNISAALPFSGTQMDGMNETGFAPSFNQYTYQPSAFTFLPSMMMPTQWMDYGTNLPQIGETPKVKKPSQ